MKFNKLFSVVFFLLLTSIIFSQKKTEQDYLSLGKSAHDNKEYDEAISDYKKALSLNPNNFQTYLELGTVYLAKKDLENFSKNLFKSIELNPNNEESYYIFGMGYALMDEPDEILKLFEEKNSDYTNWGALCGGISSIYEKMGDLDNAIRYLGKGLIKNKDVPKIYTQMGILYSTYKGDYIKAFEYFNRALEYDPTYPRAYFEIGLIYGYKNELLKAKEYFEKAIIYDSKYAAAYFNLGMCYGNLGEPLKAAEYVKKAAELGDEDAKEFLIRNNIK